MSMTPDPSTMDPSDLALGLDTTAAQGNEPSIFDSLGNVITKGVPLTGLAVVNSFANTAIDLNNWFTGSNVQRLKISDEVDGLGLDSSYNDYYNLHKEGIETAAMITGSLIPGTLAVKGLKLAQLGIAGDTVATATGIFSGPKERIIQQATQQLMDGSGLFNTFNIDKYKAIAYGLGDNALQALTFQLATAATMEASPLIDGQSFSDLAQNMFYGTLVGAGIGGGIEAIGIKRIFNKALLNADTATKASELRTYLGQGGYVAGDRVAELLASVYDAPVPASGLAIAKNIISNDKATLNAKEILNTITDGDNRLSNKFFDTLMTMRTTNGLSKEDAYGYLARLSKISPVNGDDAGVPDGKAFYINRMGTGEEISANDLVTSAPRYQFNSDSVATADEDAVDKAGTSLRYKLKDGATNFKFAKSTDSTVDFNGAVMPLFTNADDAWDQGFDLFVNKNNQVMVNPKALNIEPIARPGESRILSAAEEKEYRTTGQLPAGKSLDGAPVTMDLKTGAIAERMLPVVGDFGDVSLQANGLRYGDNFSNQSLDKPLDSSFSTIDANARYVWAHLRGIKDGDTIHSSDVPFLEELYKNAKESARENIVTTAQSNASGPQDFWINYAKSLEKRNVSFSDGTPIPMSDKEWLSQIQNAKNEVINNLLSGPEAGKLSSEDVAQIAGVHEDYLAKMLNTSDAKDFLIDHSTDSAALRHVKLWYDIGNTSIDDGQIARGSLDIQYRIQTIKSAIDGASAKFFGPGWQSFQASKSASDANILGEVGNRFLSSSNAGYDTLGNEMERIGRNVTRLYKERVASASSALTAPATALRNDPDAAAEAGIFRAVRQRTGERFSFLPSEIAQKYGLAEADGSSNVAVLSGSLAKDKVGNVLDWNKDYIPDNFRSGDQFSYYDAIGDNQAGNYTYYRLSSKVGDWERANLGLNNARIIQRNNFNSAAGLGKSFPLDTLYTPPINTSTQKFFALAKLAPGTGVGEDDVAAITASSADELKNKIAILQSKGLSVYTKDDLKQYHEVLGDYDYSRNFAQTQVDSALKSRGILNDVLPTTRAEGIIKDYTDWHFRQEMLLTRDYTELTNSQLFAELSGMGSRFADADASRMGFVASNIAKTAENPYNRYIQTALAISQKENYRLWSQSQDVLESTFDTAFNTAKRALLSANRGIIPYEQATAMTARMGLGNPYDAGIDVLKNYYDVANKLPATQVLSSIVSKAGAILGASIIKLDTFQQFIHVLSTPILTLAEANSAKQWLTTTLPDGSGAQIPATSKIFFKALGDYFNTSIRDKVMPDYIKAGFIRDPDILADHYQLIDNLTLPFGRMSEGAWSQKINDATKLAERFVGTRFSEAYTSWMAARTGHLIFEAAGYEGQSLLDQIGTFVNRAKANVTASQRPVAFQGPLGQAVGLFQTYYLNLMQQVFRYVGNGEAKSLAIAAGMQTTLFGMNSLPGFQAINNHLIGNAAGNPTHQDLYDATNNLLDKKLGDYLLYGVTSNWLGAGLYTRGDTNPRAITVLPVNPLNFPAVAGGIRVVQNLIQMQQRLSQGGSVSSSLLLGLEHNGLSRPLMGMAQLAQGFSTTDQGKLISATVPRYGDNTAGWSDLFDLSNFSRLLGARPLDEAIHLDSLYRTGIYQAKDNARMESLGEAARTTMYANQTPSTEEVANFAQQYSAAGGDIKQFGRKMIEWSNGANISIANGVFRSLASQRNQVAMGRMGGTQLPDYRNMPSTSSPSPDPWSSAASAMTNIFNPMAPQQVPQQ